MNIPMLSIPDSESHWYIRTADGIVPHSKYTGPVPQPGKIYASVTTIIGGGIPKPFPYLKWLGNYTSYDDAMAYTMQRAKEGTNVHGAMEFMTINPEKNLNPEGYSDVEWDMIWGLFRGLQTIGVSPSSVDPQFVEKVLWDDDDRTAGTADLRVCINGEWWVIDYKTSKMIKVEHKIQCMKYGTMYRKMGFPVDRVCVLRSADSVKGYDMWIGDIRDDHLQAFENARQMFWFLNPKAGPKMKEIPEYLSLSLI